jgi:hypothetical protein
VQVPGGQRDHHERGGQDGQLGRGVVADELGGEDEGGYEGTASEMPRWKRPASEWGQGSMGRTTSLPSSELVHSGFAGQWLQIWGLAR